jgi:hypothetical protein
MANPLHPVYIEEVLEARPTLNEIVGPRIGETYFPLRAQQHYHVAWERIKRWTPMAGLYDFQDKADTFGQMPAQRLLTDIMHWAARETLDPREATSALMTYQGPPGGDIDYGTGQFAETAAQKDAALVADKARLMNEAVENSKEYVRTQLLQGSIIWPPRLADGSVIPAADLPRQFGQIQINFVVPMLAADATTLDGGFSQLATTLVGVEGETGTQVAWDGATANTLADMTLIEDLMNHRRSIDFSNMRMIMAKRVMTLAAANQTAVRDVILGASRDRVLVTETQIRDELVALWGIEVQFNQSKWQFVSKADWGKPYDELEPSSIQFIPTGRVLIVPKGPLGELITAPAPGPAYSWDTNLYYWSQSQQQPPWNREMGLGIWAWPVMKDTDRHFILDAWS